MVEPPQANAPAPTWWMWAGQQCAPRELRRGDSLVGVLVAGPEATVNACGVAVAMLQGHSWAPNPSTGSW